jgi:hypothetical protein
MHNTTKHATWIDVGKDPVGLAAQHERDLVGNRGILANGTTVISFRLKNQPKFAKEANLVLQ